MSVFTTFFNLLIVHIIINLKHKIKVYIYIQGKLIENELNTIYYMKINVVIFYFHTNLLKTIFGYGKM